jgi:hypothetical protein
VVLDELVELSGWIFSSIEMVFDGGFLVPCRCKELLR